MKKTFASAYDLTGKSLVHHMREMAAEVVVSGHAYERLFERRGISHDQAQSFTERVWRNGKTVSDFSCSRQMKYLTAIEARHDPAYCAVIVFEDEYFVFGTFNPLFPRVAVLVTVCPLDEDFRKWKRSPIFRENDGEGDFAV